MTAATLPRSFAPTPGGWPIYLIRVDGAEWPIGWNEPFLPTIGGARWAEPSEITSAHVDFDLGSLAQLLFLADVDPDTVDDHDAIEAVDHALVTCGCDMTQCAAAVGAELADHPEAACSRYQRCVLRAARLLEVEP